MRVLDQDPPLSSGPRPAAAAGWPDLYVTVERLPITAYHWDDGVAEWDDAAYEWDAFAALGDMIDATCDVQGLSIFYGAPDPSGLRFDSASAAFTLANDAGQWSQYDTDGRLVRYEPGSAVAIWAEVEGEPWWLFSGEVTAWRERADTTVEIEAADGFTSLNQAIGTWTPGTYAQTPEQRLDAIATLIRYDQPTRFDTGDVTLHNHQSTATPLEEMQAVAESDGGVLFCDADGTLLYRDRAWLNGRDDQTDYRTFTDNICAADLTVVWDPELTTDDAFLVKRVHLANVAGLEVEVAVANSGPDRTIDRTSDQWVEAADGRELAEYLLTRRADAYMHLDQFTLHLHAPDQDLWLTGLDLRLGDLVRYVRDHPTGARVDLNLIVASIAHDITPSAWVTTIGTSRTIGFAVTARWDDTPFDWDEADPENVWSF